MLGCEKWGRIGAIHMEIFENMKRLFDAFMLLTFVVPAIGLVAIFTAVRWLFWRNYKVKHVFNSHTGKLPDWKCSRRLQSYPA